MCGSQNLRADGFLKQFKLPPMTLSRFRRLTTAVDRPQCSKNVLQTDGNTHFSVNQ